MKLEAGGKATSEEERNEIISQAKKGKKSDIRRFSDVL